MTSLLKGSIAGTRKHLMWKRYFFKDILLLQSSSWLWLLLEFFLLRSKCWSPLCSQMNHFSVRRYKRQDGKLPQFHAIYLLCPYVFPSVGVCIRLNRTFACWRHLTTTTRMHFAAIFVLQICVTHEWFFTKDEILSTIAPLKAFW